MKKLLFLVHRLPYPPNKGDKISSNNMLNYFSRHWRVYLGTFVDDPEDWQYQGVVDALCEESCIVPLPRHRKVTGIVSGLLNGQSLSISYYSNKKLQTWVKDTIERECPDAVLVYSGVMASFLQDLLPEKVPFVFNADDVDSEKWRSYADSRPWPLSALYAREARLLLEYERKVAASSDATIFISAEEAATFKKLAPEVASKVHNRIQGVDSNFFDPELDYENPYGADDKVLVFTGAMDYWPNIDAVKWFCDNCLPALRDSCPDLLFCIVGMKPTDEVIKLGTLPNVRVTGGVPDVRPYLAHAKAACLPLQIARGIQNKVLEAMSMELPVVATGGALIGIHKDSGDLVHKCDEPTELINTAHDLLTHPKRHNSAGRACVREHYVWETNLRHVEKYLTPATAESL